MGEALYRKYRPKRLEEVVGQNHITTTIRNALKTNKISHGYLLSGPRGVGKTSIARIIARELNNVPHDDKQENLDIIEIDAASNRRIDEIRELREKVNIAPAQGDYKVYIIDEVHMLTREAFNALLKTLEEPPKHAVFILATTEAHKLPATIISRTQHFTFKPVNYDEVSKHLINIARKENIKLDTKGAELIAKAGEGSFRDSISLLDQLSSKPSISEQDALELIGSPPSEIAEMLWKATLTGDLQAIHAQLLESDRQGYLATHIANQLLEIIKYQLINNSNLNSSALLEVSRQLIVVSNSSQPFDELELILLDFALRNNQPTNGKNDRKKDTPKKSSTPSTPKPSVATVTKTKAQSTEVKEKIMSKEKVSKTITKSDELWSAVLSALKSEHITLYGVARMATASIDKDTVTLTVAYGFHRDKLSDSKNLQLLGSLISELYGKSLDIHVAISKTEQNPVKTIAKQQEEESSTSANTVTAIFGGGEVLES